MDPKSFYDDGVAYDAEHRGYNPDENFLRWLCEGFSEGKPILNMCCGTLREGIPLARRGLNLTCVDLSSDMLSQARKKLELEEREVVSRIRLVEGDMRAVDVGLGKHRLAFVPFNSFLIMLTVEDQLSALRNLRRHVSADGVVVVDIFNPDIHRLSLVLDQSVPRLERRVEIPERDELLVRFTANSYNRSTQVMTVHFFYQVFGLSKDRSLKRSYYRDLEMRIIFPSEWRLLLKDAGLRIMDEMGNYDMSMFNADSPRMIFICRPEK